VTTHLNPGIGGGSVEHFYHFMFDYLLPLYEREVSVGIVGKGHVVRDCGPMNVWLDFVFGPDAFVKVSREKFDRGASRLLWNRKIQLDRFADRSGITIDLARFDDVLSAFRAKFVPSIPDRNRVTVLDRRPPPSFYLDGRAEKAGGGSTRRSISNLDQLTDRITSHSNASLIDFEDMPPAEQLQIINQTDVLIGQHGAGLTHLLFLHDNAVLVELNTVKRGLDHFKNLSTGIRREYREFIVDGLHVTLPNDLIEDISGYVAQRR
jgi:hypothetical protein